MRGEARWRCDDRYFRLSDLGAGCSGWIRNGRSAVTIVDESIIHQLMNSADGGDRSDLPSAGGMFPPTAWSRIAAAAREDEEENREALEELCRRYWQPARKFLRSLGCSEHDAQDLAQKFFERWARPENFRRLDPEMGRLRSYMKQSLRRTFINEWRHSNTRGKAGTTTVSIDSDSFCEEPGSDRGEADWVYDRAWAETVMASVLCRLRDRYVARGREDVFDHLREALPGGGVLKPYAEIGVSLGMKEPRIKLEVHRLRRRFADELRSEVAATLADSSDLEDELRYLVQVMVRTGQSSDA